MPPSRRACVRIMLIAGRVDPRWFSPCGCVPGFVANRSLGGIVTATRTRGHSNPNNSGVRVPDDLGRGMPCAYNFRDALALIRLPLV